MTVVPISAVRAMALGDLRFTALRSPSTAAPPDIEPAVVAMVVRDLLETLYSTPHGVGLAAPQIGLLIRILVIDLGRPRRGAQPRVLINPQIEDVSEEVDDSYESCLSIPLAQGIVPRACEIKVRALDHRLARVEFESGGFEARVIQHEVDHLDGVLYPDRMRSDGVIEELQPIPELLADRAEAFLYSDEAEE